MKDEINEAAKTQIKGYFRQAQFLFFAFLAGLILFLVTAYIVILYQKALNPEYTTFLLIAAPLSGVALVLMSNRLFQGRVKTAKEGKRLYDKMEGYRSGMVLRFILLDGAAFIQLISYVMTGNRVYLLLCLVIVTLFLLNRPNVDKFIRDMELNDLEARVIRDHYSA